MQAELPAFIAQQIADPNVHLTESLYVPLSPELKTELKGYAMQAAISFVCLGPSGPWATSSSGTMRRGAGVYPGREDQAG